MCSLGQIEGWEGGLGSLSPLTLAFHLPGPKLWRSLATLQWGTYWAPGHPASSAIMLVTATDICSPISTTVWD